MYDEIYLLVYQQQKREWKKSEDNSNDDTQGRPVDNMRCINEGPGTRGGGYAGRGMYCWLSEV